MTFLNREIRHGFTLVEVMIAMVLFTVALGVAIQALQAAKSYEALGNAQDDLQTDGRVILGQIGNDLICSSWYFPDAKKAGVIYPGVTPAVDRTLRYYPYVQIPGNVGSKFPQHLRDSAANRPNLPSEYDSLLPGISSDATSGAVSDWKNSFYAPSQEIVFLKSTVSFWNSKTDSFYANQDQVPVLDFVKAPRNTWRAPSQHETLNILHPSGWQQDKDGAGNVLGYLPRPVDPLAPSGPKSDQEPYGVVMESGLLLEPTGELSNIGVNWQTISGEGFKPPPDLNDTVNGIDVSDLKEFSYCVVPSPYGFGRLVRAIRVNNATSYPAGKIINSAGGVYANIGILLSRNGDDGMVVDKVLSDHVVRVVFDTYRTVDKGAAEVVSLDINQIKVRVFMARQSNINKDLLISKVFETVVSMRAQNSSRDKDFQSQDAGSNSTFLGKPGIGLQ